MANMQAFRAEHAAHYDACCRALHLRAFVSALCDADRLEDDAVCQLLCKTAMRSRGQLPGPRPAGAPR